MQGNWESWRNSFWWYANREIFLGKMTRKGRQKFRIFSRKRRHFGGQRTETKCVKWSSSRKRLRTAALDRILSLFMLLAL